MTAVHGLTGLWAWHSGLARLPAALLFDRPAALRLAVGGQGYEAVSGGQIWRLASSVLLHVDVVHLGVNLMALLALGRILEPWLGARRWLAWFCAGGLAGSVASQLSGSLQSDGASGAGFALLGAAAVMAWRRREGLDPEDRRLLLPMLWGFLGLNVVLSFVLPFVDAAGHLGGLGLGLGLGWLGDAGRDARAWVVGELGLIGLFVGLCAWGWWP